jgi:hypothetical protein
MLSSVKYDFLTWIASINLPFLQAPRIGASLRVCVFLLIIALQLLGGFGTCLE